MFIVMENKDEYIHVKVTHEDKKNIKAKADELRLSLSSYCRMVIQKDVAGVKT